MESNLHSRSFNAFFCTLDRSVQTPHCRLVALTPGVWTSRNPPFKDATKPKKRRSDQIGKETIDAKKQGGDGRDRRGYQLELLTLKLSSTTERVAPIDYCMYFPSKNHPKWVVLNIWQIWMRGLKPKNVIAAWHSHAAFYQLVHFVLEPRPWIGAVFSFFW